MVEHRELSVQHIPTERWNIVCPQGIKCVNHAFIHHRHHHHQHRAMANGQHYPRAVPYSSYTWTTKQTYKNPYNNISMYSGICENHLLLALIKYSSYTHSELRYMCTSGGPCPNQMHDFLFFFPLIILQSQIVPRQWVNRRDREWESGLVSHGVCVCMSCTGDGRWAPLLCCCCSCSFFLGGWFVRHGLGISDCASDPDRRWNKLFHSHKISADRCYLSVKSARMLREH